MQYIFFNLGNSIHCTLVFMDAFFIWGAQYTTFLFGDPIQAQFIAPAFFIWGTRYSTSHALAPADRQSINYNHNIAMDQIIAWSSEFLNKVFNHFRKYRICIFYLGTQYNTSLALAPADRQSINYNHNISMEQIVAWSSEFLTNFGTSIHKSKMEW